MQPVRLLNRRHLPILLCLALLAALWFGFLHWRELFDPDEGRYAEIPREMLASGDWITPRLNGLKYFEKPALQYWATAASFYLFGVGELSARLWTALCGLATLGFAGVSARRLGGRRAGCLAVLALASSAQFLAFSQILTLDMGVTCFLTLTWTAWLGAQDERLTRRQRGAWSLTLWIAMALAVLSKGLIGVVLPALVFGTYLAATRDGRALRSVRSIAGIAALLLVAAPWFVLVTLRNPEFLQFFFIDEHLNRFLEGGHHRPGPGWFFIAVLALGSLPWLPLYLRALRDAVAAQLAAGRWWSRRSDPVLIPLLWAIVVTAFFSASRSKLPGYIVPVYPAVAVLLGVGWARSGRPPADVLPLRTLALLGATLAIAAPFAAHLRELRELSDAGSAYQSWIVAAGLIMMGVAALAHAVRRRALTPVAVFALGTMLALQTLLGGTQSIARHFSSRRMVQEATAAAGGFDPTAPFFSVGMYDQTVPIHLGRLVTVVAYGDEFRFGIRQQPWLAIEDIRVFRERWTAAGHAYAIMPRDVLVRELLHDMPMYVLAESRRYVIVSRQPRVATAPPPR